MRHTQPGGQVAQRPFGERQVDVDRLPQCESQAQVFLTQPASVGESVVKPMAGFEFAGSLMTWANAYRVYKDKGYAGVWLPAVCLFALWGFWNLYYYPHLGQWASFTAGISIMGGNIVWVALMRHYGRKI